MRAPARLQNALPRIGRPGTIRGVKQKKRRHRVRTRTHHLGRPITRGALTLLAAINIALMCLSVVLVGFAQPALAAIAGAASVRLAHKLARQLLP